MSEKGDYEVGYRKPPKATQFAPGVTGNAKGRPKKASKNLPYERVLGQLVPFPGCTRKIRADEAFIRQLMNRAVKNGGRWASLARRAIALARCVQGPIKKLRTIIYGVYPSAGFVHDTMRKLGMATKLDPCGLRAKMVIEPWLVAAALDRLGDRRLTPEEQQVIVAATRKPHAVRWPDWWSAEVE